MDMMVGVIGSLVFIVIIGMVVIVMRVAVLMSDWDMNGRMAMIFCCNKPGTGCHQRKTEQYLMAGTLTRKGK